MSDQFSRHRVIAFHVLLLICTSLWLAFVHYYGGVRAAPPIPARLSFTGWVGALLVCAMYASFLCSRRQRAAVLLAVIVWIVAALVLAELLLAGTQKRMWVGFDLDGELGWYARANQSDTVQDTPFGQFVFSTDELGHRNREAYPADGKIPVMVQGDSNIFGFGVPYDATLCAQLNRDRNPALYYNFGMLGFDVNHYYFQYEKFSKRFDIGSRVIMFNIGNDFTMTAMRTAELLRRPYLSVENNTVREVRNYFSEIPQQVYGHHFVPKYAAFDARIRDPLFRNAGEICLSWISQSRVGFFVFDKVYRDGSKIGQRLFRRGDQAGVVTVSYPYWLLLKQVHWPEPFRSYGQDFLRVLQAVHAQNSNLILCVYPMKRQIVPGFRVGALTRLKGLGYTDEDIDFFSFNRFIAGICNEAGIALVDVTPQFRAHDRPEDLFLEDVHLSAEALTICAEAIQEAATGTFFPSKVRTTNAPPQPSG
jgi:hypothetical protein